MKESKYLMIIGGGILQIPAIQTANAMGIKTIVTDYDPNAFGLKVAHHPVLMSTRDVDGTVRIAKELAKKMPIDGVMTVGTDASKTVAAVANALGLPGIRFEDADCASNKIKMRHRFKEHGVPCPDFYGVWSYSEAIEAFNKLEKPVVVKPTDNMGARGVMKVNNVEELSQAFEMAKKNSPSGEIIVEEYMEGDELSIDALVFDNEVFVTGIADRIIEYPPYFVETGHVMPSQKPKEILDEAVRVMKLGIKALGITVGAAKGDIKITKNGIKIVELAARLSGGFMSTYTYPYSTGVNLMKAAIKVTVGQKPSLKELTPKWKKVAIERGIIPKPGIIKEIKGLGEAEQIKGVKNIFITSDFGEEVVVPKNNVEKAGHVIVEADTHEEAFAIADEALKKIEVVTLVEVQPTLEEIRKKATEKFNKTCFACKDCNGIDCKGKIPGMGSVGTGYTFQNNVVAIRNINVIPSYIHSVKKPDMKTDFFKVHLNIPVMVAPITGTKTNMGDRIDEECFQEDLALGALNSGIISIIGDGASPFKYEIGARAIKKANGHGIQIFKPREDQKEIIKRIKHAENSGAVAIGIDIDAASFITMKLKNQAVEPKTIKQIEELVNSTNLPFIIKGIMSVEDAKNAIKAGAKVIYISNHGGRVLDYMPATIDVLPEIKKAVGNKAKIIIDGGFRDGLDIYKALALGADYVAIGRPAAIAIVGGGCKGLGIQVKQWKEELYQAMLLTGTGQISDINSTCLKT